LRLSITILLFALVFTAKTNVFAHSSGTDGWRTQSGGRHIKKDLKVSDLTTKNPTEAPELKKGVQTTPGYILHLLSRFSYTSIEARHFLDAFFVSFFAYYATYNTDTKDYYLIHHIATHKALEIIYPYHSFW
jgi:hypothetical protein